MRGMDVRDVGELAASLPVVLHELSPQSLSLEEAFMELTGESVEYQGAPTGPRGNGTGGGWNR
ncbi:MAG: hypothetical protein ACRDYZ_01595 [Acidimicrobiales bacterium]